MDLLYRLAGHHGVLWVTLILWIGLFLYLLRLDRRIATLESAADHPSGDEGTS